jgi:UDP-N-acetylmuramoyl-tripeptide--D-alanyl-D-alanine ligase
MLELGKFSEDCHKDVGEHALSKVDVVYLLGEECRPIVQRWDQANRPAAIYEDHQKLIERLRCDIQPGDVVLVKGSRAKEMWKVIDEI